MQPFTTLTASAAPLPAADVDTDQIVPARFLKFPREDGYGGFLFRDLRGRADFPLDDPAHAGAGILVAGRNFGCGSSREGAVYALMDAGFRCVLAPSFGDIFYSNCLKNGVLPVQLPDTTINALLARVAAQPSLRITVDLAAQTVTAGNDAPVAFEIDPSRKTLLLQGLDDIGLTMQLRPEIEAFEASRRTEQPWLPV